VEKILPGDFSLAALNFNKVHILLSFFLSFFLSFLLSCFLAFFLSFFLSFLQSYEDTHMLAACFALFLLPASFYGLTDKCQLSKTCLFTRRKEQNAEERETNIETISSHIPGQIFSNTSVLYWK